MLSALPRHIVLRLPPSQVAISTKTITLLITVLFCKFIYLICQGIIAHHLFIGYDTDNTVTVMLHKNSPLPVLTALKYIKPDRTATRVFLIHNLNLVLDVALQCIQRTFVSNQMSVKLLHVYL